jgi:ABC-type xylose transport system permease subunit
VLEESAKVLAIEKVALPMMLMLGHSFICVVMRLGRFVYQVGANLQALSLAYSQRIDRMLGYPFIAAQVILCSLSQMKLVRRET